MSVDLTSISSRASISSGDSPKPSIRDKLLALKQKAALAAGEPTDPAYAHSFGDPLSDLDGRRRWLLDGLARERWDPDLRGRVREILRENEGELYKGRNIQRTSTVSHCWMIGHDVTRAHPTVVISCNHSTILKRTMRVIAQHGVLKDAKFSLKGIPFCDLKYRMESRDDVFNKSSTIDKNDSSQHEGFDFLSPPSSPGFDNNEVHPHDQTMIESVWEDEEQETDEKTVKETYETRDEKETRKVSQVTPIQLDVDNADQDQPALRVGAEEITIPRSGRLTTLGGFIMVDDVCFGLTTAHAFTEGKEDHDFGQKSISESQSELHLYDMDWANDYFSDSNDSNDGENDTNFKEASQIEQQLQPISKGRVADGQEYRSETGELRCIAASSQHLSANGLDWALCELGEWGKYAINGVYLPSELRTDQAREYLLFNNLKTSPPSGRVLVATRRGVISGHGTGSDSIIKLGGDDDYRHVWSIQVEESLCSGDSGSWVVDAMNGDVYGMVVAGSTGLREEYIIPAVDIGQDIRGVMRAETVRLPNWQDVVSSHAKGNMAKRSQNLDSNIGTIDWDLEGSVDEEQLEADDERFLLAEILKHSSIDTESLVKAIKIARIRPQWSKIALPKGLTIRTAQRSIDRLLTGRATRRKPRVYGEEYARRWLEQDLTHRSSRNVSSSRSEKLHSQHENDQGIGNDNVTVPEEPPELLDSNPNFRAEKSRRAWRAKRQADRGPKPHHRKHHRNRRSGEEFDDLVLQGPGPIEQQSASHHSKFEMDSEDDQENLDPDIILVRHKGSIYNSKFPAFSIADGSLLVGDLRQQVAKDFGIDDASRVTLLYKGKALKLDFRACHEEGLKMRSEILCRVKRTPPEELEFLSNKFRTELVPQGLDFMTNTPTDTRKRDFEYRKITETILSQIVLKLDVAEIGDNQDARIMRKKLVSEVQTFLKDLDDSVEKDAPSDWHADFLPQKETRRSSMNLPERPKSLIRSDLHRNDSKEKFNADDGGIG